MRYLTFILLLMFVAGSYPNLYAEEIILTRDYTCSDLDGNKRWHAQAKIIKAADENLFVLTEEGSGIYTGFEGEISWKSELEFEDTGDIIRPLNQNKDIFNKNGKLIARETQSFDYSSRKASYLYEDLVADKKTSKKLGFSRDIVNRLLFFMYLQESISEKSKRKKFQILNSEPNIYTMDARIIETEVITVDGRARRAYKIRIKPDAGIFNVFQIMLPKLYVWNQVKADGRWLKYEGPETDPSSIRVIITAGL